MPPLRELTFKQAEADRKAAEEAAQLRLRENIARQTELLEQLAKK